MKHHCEKELPFAEYGQAIDECEGNDKGELWVSNGEYASQVNFCPFCGTKAKKEAIK